MDNNNYLKDGLIYCGKCHTPKQVRINLDLIYGRGGGFVAPCLCECGLEASENAVKANAVLLSCKETKKLYHVTTPKKAKRYHQSGCILKPVRGFTTLSAAMAWAIKTGRTVIYAVEGSKLKCYKLPDHHNEYGQAWWFDENIKIDNIKCVFSAKKDA